MSVISKIFEILIFKKLIMLLESVFSKYQCGFRKGHSAQHYLLVIIQKRKSVTGKFVKSIGCLPHSLLVPKRYAYRFHKNVAEYLKD